MQTTKVIFLDFDGVLNSDASFYMEKHRRTKGVIHTLSEVACSNLRIVLEKYPALGLVISSTWRKLHSLAELEAILVSYGVPAARIVDITPQTLSGHRGHEIRSWLTNHPEVRRYVILDDDGDAGVAADLDLDGLFIRTDYRDGFLLSQAHQAIEFLRG